MEKKMTKAAVLWYSQSGNTKRYGRHIAAILRNEGIAVTDGDYRDFDTGAFNGADLIIAGTPVYYYEVPVNFRNWISSIKNLNGSAVASFATYGGEGGNQYNTALNLLRLMAGKGGIPVGMDTFGAMSTFALTWSSGNTERILKYRNRPDGAIYDKIRDFTHAILKNASAGIAIRVRRKPDYRELIKGGVSISGTKLMIKDHHIDEASCTSCGTCEKKCPVGAIRLANFSMDTSRCVACLGCVNNCPAGAMKMSFMGKEVYGFREFCRRHGISIMEPIV